MNSRGARVQRKRCAGRRILHHFVSLRWKETGRQGDDREGLRGREGGERKLAPFEGVKKLTPFSVLLPRATRVAADGVSVVVCWSVAARRFGGDGGAEQGPREAGPSLPNTNCSFPLSVRCGRSVEELMGRVQERKRQVLQRLEEELALEA
eukprot:3685676-Rhodomonas_salina.1